MHLRCLPILLAASLAAVASADDWPQWRGPQRDGVWRETGVMERFAVRQLPAAWRAPVKNGYTGPTVAGGRVYVMDRVLEPRPQERVLCFDAVTGRPRWTFAYDALYGGVGYPDGPRASVTISGGRAFALGAVGHLHCLDAVSGEKLWGRDLQKEYTIRMPVWGIAGAPLVERDAVIVQIGGEGNACVVAFDARTGRERWRALGDNPSYSAPIVIRQAGRRVLVCWTGDRVVGLDPASGRLHWEYPFPSRQVVIAIATPVIDGDRLFLTSFYQGSLMLRLLQDRLGVEKLWQRRGASERDTDALHSIISTPIIQGDFVYGVDSYGELRCLDARSGDRVWEDRTAVPRERWATIHFVKNGERVWMFNDRGELIIARLTPQRFEEISRAFLIRPTLGQLPEQRRGGVAWSHPAFAGRRIYLRNDDELICVDLSAPRPARAGG